MDKNAVIGTNAIPRESNGGVPINIQDQVSDVIDLYMHIEVSSGNLLAVDAAIDDTDITLTGGHGVIIGQVLCIKEGLRFYQGLVLNVVVNVVSLDTPLDYDFTTAAFICVGNRELNVDGTAQKIAHIKPLTGTKWDITRMLILIEDDVVMDTAKFGGIAALTNGIVLRVKNTDYKNIFNIKSNGEFGERAYDIGYDDRAPAGTYGFRCRRTFAGQEKNGVVIRLEGDLSGELQLLIRDDLTALAVFHMIVQGHVVSD